MRKCLWADGEGETSIDQTERRRLRVKALRKVSQGDHLIDFDWLLATFRIISIASNRNRIMKTHRFTAKALGSFVALALVGMSSMGTSATASVTYFSSQSSFESQGAILSHADFNSFGTGVSIIGTGTVIGDVIINTSPYGVVFGTANSSRPTVENVVVQPNFSSVVIDVAPGPQTFNMLGFNLGSVIRGSGAQVTIITNLAEYHFSVASPHIASSLAFQGFVTSSVGEYIIQFQAYAAPTEFGGGAAVGAIELGTTAAVPEPGSLTLIGSAGLASLVVFVRRRVNGK